MYFVILLCSEVFHTCPYMTKFSFLTILYEFCRDIYTYLRFIDNCMTQEKDVCEVKTHTKNDIRLFNKYDIIVNYV